MSFNASGAWGLSAAATTHASAAGAGVGRAADVDGDRTSGTDQPLTSELGQKVIDRRLDLHGVDIEFVAQSCADFVAPRPLLEQLPDPRARRIQLENAIRVQVDQ